MTRKHYKELAAALASGFDLANISKGQETDILKPLISVFNNDNPRFNPEKFIMAIDGYKQTING